MNGNCTKYIHQCWKLYSKKKDKFNSKDVEIINQCIELLYKIQIEFVGCQDSINRFKILFNLS